MLGLAFAFGLVGGLIGLACNQAENPTIRNFRWRKRLEGIARVPDRKLNRQGAEDGLILARRLGDLKLAKRFEKLVASQKRQP